MLLAAVATFGSQPVSALQGDASVRLTVQVVHSSGTCGATQRDAQVVVQCAQSDSTVQPLPSELRELANPADVTGLRRFALPPLAMGEAEGTAIYSGGVEISSWRVVSFDNGSYVELTIAW